MLARTLSLCTRAQHTSPGPTAPLPSRLANRRPCHKTGTSRHIDRRSTRGSASPSGWKRRCETSECAEAPIPTQRFSWRAPRPPYLFGSCPLHELSDIDRPKTISTRFTELVVMRTPLSMTALVAPQLTPDLKPSPTANVHIKRLKLQGALAKTQATGPAKQQPSGSHPGTLRVQTRQGVTRRILCALLSPSQSGTR